MAPLPSLGLLVSILVAIDTFVSAIRISRPLGHDQLELNLESVVASSKSSRIARKPVLFTHIHKNSGTTMCQAAIEAGEHIVGPGVNCNYRGPLFDDGFYARSRNESWTDCDTRQKLYASGFTWGAIEREIDEGDLCPQIINVISLRDPVARIISDANCNYGQRIIDDYSLKSCADHGDCKDAISPLAKGVRGAQADNYLIRVLNGHEGLNIPFGEVGTAHLAVAKSKLEKYDLVVFVEHLDSPKTAKRMDEIIGWHLKLGTRENPSNHHDFSETARTRLTKMNKLDYDLYNYAMEKWRW